MFLLLALSTPDAAFSGATFCGVNSDIDPPQLSAPYDLRNRSTYIQVTNTTTNNVTIHVQIFQNDRGCDELNFDDTLTGNDTVIYDLSNIIRNDGTPVPVNLLDDSNGYVVVTDRDSEAVSTLIGNFRIIDDTGYEYRTNMAGVGPAPDFSFEITNYIANFNTIDGALWADVIGYAYDNSDTSTVTNLDLGVDFSIFVFDLQEEPLSCDTRNFACGSVMNYGINEDYFASRGDALLCPGGGLADPNGGFISFENGFFVPIPNVEFDGDEIFIGLIGINNADGTGSMDYWIHTPFFPPAL